MNVTFQFPSRDAARKCRLCSAAGIWTICRSRLMEPAIGAGSSWRSPISIRHSTLRPMYRRTTLAPCRPSLLCMRRGDVPGTESPAPDDEPTSAEASDEIEPEIHEEPAVEDPIPAAAPEPAARRSLPTRQQSVEQTAQPGELILQINGPMLPAAAKLRAVHFAKQLGLEITLRDASTMAVVEVVKAAATRGKGGRSNANDLIIEMCMRPEGATVTELRKAASERGASISGDVKDRIEKLAQEHGLDFKCEAVFRNNKPVIGFFLSHADEEGQDIAAD
jgi:hypothetical protein